MLDLLGISLGEAYNLLPVGIGSPVVVGMAESKILLWALWPRRTCSTNLGVQSVRSHDAAGMNINYGLDADVMIDKNYLYFSFPIRFIWGQEKCCHVHQGLLFESQARVDAVRFLQPDQI